MPAPTSTAVDMPATGHFVEGIISLVGVQLYEWSSAAELALRKTLASSADVSVTHVSVGSVTARQINRRRRLLSTPALDVEYVIYAPSPEKAAMITERITSDIESGSLTVMARNNGLSAVISITSVQQEALSISESSSPPVFVLINPMLYVALCLLSINLLIY